MNLSLHNTATKKIEELTPLEAKRVRLYTCGPTVYDYQHIGNYAAYIYWDTLVRTLLVNGYGVERVMNITDVGHLVSDADEGEDKLEKGARREGKTAWQVAEFYTNDFMNGIEKLGVILPEHIARATDYIPQQLDLIRTLKDKGYTYQISDGIYFDTAKFPPYADFARLNLEELKAGARVEVNPEKYSPSDFALWKFTPPGTRRDMEWETPSDLLDDAAESQTMQASAKQGGTKHRTEPYTKYGVGGAEALTQYGAGSDEGAASPAGQQVVTAHGPVMGFPGWHLECSAIAMNFLGPTLDIHTGGIDHIPVHHTNEIAQSEAATGQRFVNFWLHNNHLKADGTKISKSLGNGYTLPNLEEKGFSPLDFRLFVLQSHYQSEGNFTFEALASAKNRRNHWRAIAALRWQVPSGSESSNGTITDMLITTEADIREALSDNLNTPEALRMIDGIFSRLETQPLTVIPGIPLVNFLKSVDELLGLQLIKSVPDIDAEAKRLIAQREQARLSLDWEKSDQLRLGLAKQGITVRDTAEGAVWSYSG